MPAYLPYVQSSVYKTDDIPIIRLLNMRMHPKLQTLGISRIMRNGNILQNYEYITFTYSSALATVATSFLLHLNNGDIALVGPYTWR